MFLEINDISTGTVIQEPLNVYSINFVFEKEVGGKYDIIYVLNNGLTKVEEFDTSTEAANRLYEIKEINAAGSKVYTYKGSCTFANLPTTGNDVGDVWNITDDFTLGGKDYPAGTNVAWDGTGWDALAGSIDLSNYYTKTETDDAIAEAPTYKPFPETFPTTGTTQNFLTAVLALDLPAGSLYLGEVTFSDLPTGIGNAEIEVSIYEGNVVWCDLRSSNVAPYSWQCNSHTYRGWEPTASGGIAPKGLDVGGPTFVFATHEPGIYFLNNYQSVRMYSDTRMAKFVDGFPLGGSHTIPGVVLYYVKSVDSANTNDVIAYGTFMFRDNDNKIFNSGILRVTRTHNTPSSSDSGMTLTCFEPSSTLGNLLTTSAQTISGVKTFSSLPISTGVPSTDGQLANKKYVDDQDVISLYTLSGLSAYSSSSTYAEGDYVYYNGLIYKCNTAIPVAEEWTPAHWTQKTYVEYMTEETTGSIANTLATI